MNFTVLSSIKKQYKTLKYISKFKFNQTGRFIHDTNLGICHIVKNLVIITKRLSIFLKKVTSHQKNYLKGISGFSKVLCVGTGKKLIHSCSWNSLNPKTPTIYKATGDLFGYNGDMGITIENKNYSSMQKSDHTDESEFTLN